MDYLIVFACYGLRSSYERLMFLIYQPSIKVMTETNQAAAATMITESTLQHLKILSFIFFPTSVNW